jgi:hypothetical protein
MNGIAGPAISFARVPVQSLCSARSPSPACARRGCTVPGEGWSPAETEHSGEAPRRRRGVCAAACSVRLSSCCRTDRRTRPRDGGVATLGVAHAARGLDARQRGAAFTPGALPVDSRPTTTDDGDARPRQPTPATHDHDDDRAATRRRRGGSAPPRCSHRPRPGDDDHRRRRPRPSASRNSESGSGHVVRRGTGGDVRQPDAPVRDRADGDEQRHRGDTTCTVDDREQAGYPRVVDMSPSGFAQLADPSQGVVDVTISW